jgi:hypothetical protein
MKQRWVDHASRVGGHREGGDMECGVETGKVEIAPDILSQNNHAEMSYLFVQCIRLGRDGGDREGGRRQGTSAIVHTAAVTFTTNITV